MNILQELLKKNTNISEDFVAKKDGKGFATLISKEVGVKIQLISEDTNKNILVYDFQCKSKSARLLGDVKVTIDLKKEKIDIVRASGLFTMSDVQDDVKEGIRKGLKYTD